MKTTGVRSGNHAITSLVALAFSVCCVIPLQATAAPVAFTIATGAVRSADGTAQCMDVGTFDTTGQSQSACSRQFKVSGYGSYSTVAQYGNLGAQSEATSNNLPALNQGGSAAASAEFQEAFTFQSSPCSTGGCMVPGSFTVIAMLEGSAYALHGGDAHGSLDLSLTNLSDPVSGRSSQSAMIKTALIGGGGTSTNGPCGPSTGDLENGLFASGQCVLTVTVPWNVGDTVRLYAGLQVYAMARPTADPVTGDLLPGLASAHFGNTAKIMGIAMYDGDGNRLEDVAFTTASGTAYPALVPLPAAAWLFGTGLLGLGVAARRRRCPAR